MDSLVRFGQYNFTQKNQVSLRDNFRDVVPRTTRLPGLSGGFDEYGQDAAPLEIGNVQVVFWMHADSIEEMETLKQDIGKLPSYGVTRLYKQPLDSGQGERYCEARANSVDYHERASQQPHRRMQVTVNFQAANPVWLALGTEGWAWGDGTGWGTGAIWGGSAAPQAVSGVQNDFTITPEGNAQTFPRITINCGASQTASGVTIQRLVSGEVVDEIKYDATLGNNDSLEINCRALSVKLNGSDAYSSVFTFLRAHWFLLEPGENSIRVLMDNAGDAADVYMRYYEAYR